MTEIATRDEQPTGLEPVEPMQQVPMTGLVLWARKASAANGIAQSLARTPFVPESLRVYAKQEDPPEKHDQALLATAANITAAILTGDEIGLQPMAAMRSIDIVKGTPAMRAHAMRALVQSRGHEIWPTEQTETRVIMHGRRKGDSNTITVTWTMDRARKLGVAGGRNYQSQPGTMLIARATAEICRLIAADVLLGVPYAIEELDDQPDLTAATVASVAPAEPKKRTAKRKPIEQVAPPEPELVEPTQSEVAPVEAVQKPAELPPEPDLELDVWPTPAPIPD